MKRITVHFGNTEKTYDYWASDSDEIGDRVIVDTPHQGYRLVEVLEVQHCQDHEAANLKRIVCPVADAEYVAWFAQQPSLDDVEPEDDPELEDEDEEDSAA